MTGQIILSPFKAGDQQTSQCEAAPTEELVAQLAQRLEHVRAPVLPNDRGHGGGPTALHAGEW